MKLPNGIQLDSDQNKVAAILRQLALDIQENQNTSFSKKLSKLLKIDSAQDIKGIYIHGSVGRGKTMLMDAFYNDLRLKEKQRWHFHEFMQHVHQRLKQISQNTDKVTQDQPIITLAREIGSKTKLLCFDEFHVTDIADAMILGRLFSKLFEMGVVVVATSNQHPDELYSGGLHRDRFLPFIELLKRAAPEIELDGPVDYRRQILQKHKRYFTPNTHDARHEMLNLFKVLATDHKSQTVMLESKGRKIEIKEAANGMALTSFSQLCENPLGPADYLCLADNFHTLFLENVPKLSPEMHNEVKRFTTLIDILYDRGIHLIISAESKPDILYTSGKNSQAFGRTVSRLIEMTGG